MESGCQTLPEEQISSAKRILKAVKAIYPDEDANEEPIEPLDSSASHATLLERSERLLRPRAETGDPQAQFLLGLVHFEKHHYAEALEAFNSIKDQDPQALYQLGVMHFDGLGTPADPALAVEYMRRVSQSSSPQAGHIKYAALYFPVQALAVEYMRRVSQSSSPQAGHIKYAALYNIGQAYLEGYGVPVSSTEAERYWLQAAADGNPDASVKAQSSLGLLYSRPELLDLKKAFSWHSEACGNGSLESQGALGIMYLHGQGIRKDMESGLYCLRRAAERGNVYAQGHLVAYYYHQKIYSKAVGLAKRISEYQDICAIARETECLPEFVAKGIAMALFYYGRCLQLGHGTPQDRAQAELCFTKAVKLDSKVCKELQMDITLGKL
ncbi:LRP2-binding protein isoform X1 [Alosa sapidissima]|uniref:LRP2-binding protein isoform X1 n=1 Tax=Alosa sapidissima TaxID=34773 RepID=UPI001C094650|nr:LRP2-binding protein isoform X1 [Alosa sapidissima]XP_041930673.1 LRP2-binding protein isoform X1 [Alosa sapidissima]